MNPYSVTVTAYLVLAIAYIGRLFWKINELERENFYLSGPSYVEEIMKAINRKQGKFPDILLEVIAEHHSGDRTEGEKIATGISKHLHRYDVKRDV